MDDHTYIAIDLKSFYASVECVERGRNPLTTNLVVADESRTEKTICLAVSPSMKAYGISGRARLFEVVQKIKEVNRERQRQAPGGNLEGASDDDAELRANRKLAVDYIVAKPRMSFYMEYSTKIYNIYLKYVAPEDIHVYSVDEVFMDVTAYLNMYRLTPRELAMKMIQDVLDTTGITATAGIGTNLYLCKIAMDVLAKHIDADANGVRIASLNEMSYRRLFWAYQPITDFWRIGKGYAKKLAEHGMYTMGDVARCSLGKDSDFYNEDLLYRLFGVNAELLIDHAWGWEPCTIEEIKAYKPKNNSVGAGQVLKQPYPFDKARLVIHEMADSLVLDLVDKGLVTDQMVLTVGYDRVNLSDSVCREEYRGEVTVDRYGREIPKHAHGTVNLGEWTSSSKVIIRAVLGLFDRIMDRNLLVRRLNITAGRVIDETEAGKRTSFRQMELSMGYEEEGKAQREKQERVRERKMQKAVLDIKKKYGKNAILKGMNLEEGATARERNRQIGGHRA